MAVKHMTVALLLGVTGCAGGYGASTRDPAAVPSVAEMARVSNYTARNWIRPRTAYDVAVDARATELRREPITKEAAVELALLRHPPLRKALRERSQLRPWFVRDLAEVEGERPPEWRLLGLSVARNRDPRGRWQFGAETVELAEIIVERAGEAREAWIDAVAARQLSLNAAAVAEKAEAAAELASEQYRSGTGTRFEVAERKLEYGEALKASAAAEVEAFATREALARMLLLAGEERRWELPDALPPVPTEEPRVGDVEAVAVREGLAALTARAGLSQWAQGVDLRSNAREAYNRLQAAWEVARYQEDVMLPASEALLDEAQLFYNGMIEDVYALIDAAQDRNETRAEHVEAVAAYWRAHAELTQLLGGRTPEELDADTEVALQR